MCDQPPDPMPGPRDIVGAWLICALVVIVALAFSGDLNGTSDSQPVAAATAPNWSQS